MTYLDIVKWVSYNLISIYHSTHMDEELVEITYSNYGLGATRTQRGCTFIDCVLKANNSKLKTD